MMISSDDLIFHFDNNVLSQSSLDTEWISWTTIANRLHAQYLLCSQVKNGHVKRIEDEEIQSFAIEVGGKNTR